ncbi:MAG: hypothetical protein IJE97_02105 [Thermoguttaceae bacterium]|nr:hypothetical protein [Thermoguttaceae bacterium]MBQ6829140.1 hypothetical protein [Thermoguttaceae bacterium]
MSKRTVLLGVALGFCFALSGCGSSTDGDGAPDSNVPAANGSDANGGSGDETNAPLNVEDAESPEGVVDAFFRSFFKGDDDAAFALLTSKAQEATREQFAAQASDTIRWKATKKTALDDGRVCVCVDVEDYAETGEIQLEELAFVVSNADGAWRVAGFSVGDLAIDFEERQINAVAQESDAFSTDEAVKVGQTSENVVR